MDIKRKQAAYIIDRIRVVVAEALLKGEPSPEVSQIMQILENNDIMLPAKCSGEAHSNAHIDNCSVCMKGLDWGWAGSPAKVK